jgi:hypothetical protein
LSAAIALVGPASAATRDVMAFEISVLPEARRHVGMLEYPPYLAVALENIGMQLTSSKVTILDPAGLQYKTVVLRFVGRKGPIYSYEASGEWGVGMLRIKLKLPVEADISMLDKGKVSVRMYPPSPNLIPSGLNDLIKLKAQSLADIIMQKNGLDYFDSLQQQSKSGSGMENIFNQILVQAYNSRMDFVDPAARTSRAAEPDEIVLRVTDQYLLLVTLIIWLVSVRLGALELHLRRRFGQRHAAA